MPSFWVLPVFAPVLLVLMAGHRGGVWLMFLYGREVYPGEWLAEVSNPDLRLLPEAVPYDSCCRNCARWCVRGQRAGPWEHGLCSRKLLQGASVPWTIEIDWCSSWTAVERAVEDQEHGL